MENEITSPRAGHRLRALGGAGPAGHDGPGHLPGHAGRRLTLEPRTLLRGSLARERRAARRDRQPNRPLVPDRVPRALGPGRAHGKRPVRPGQASTCATRCARCRTAGSCSSGAPIAEAGRSSSRSRPRRDRAQTTVTRTEFEAYDDLRGLDLLAGRARGPPALPRLHARQARPVLCALRAAALRGAPRRARARLGLAGARTSEATGSPATSSASRRASTTAASTARRPGRSSTSTSPGGSTCASYRGRSIYTFAVQAAERAVRERTGLVGIDDLVARASGAARTGRLASPSPPAAGHTSVRVDDERRRPDAAHLQLGVARAARRASSSVQPDPEQALAHEAPDEHEPALVVERARAGRRP